MQDLHCLCRRLRTLVAVLILGAIAPASLALAQQRSVDETSVHAAYAINFLRYARWPADTGRDPLVIAVVGSAQTAGAFRTLVRDAGPIDGRPVVVRAVPVNAAAPNRREAVRALAEPLKDADLVYVAPSHDAWQRAVIDRVGNQATLTVGTGEDFVAHGGMVGFRNDRGRVHFVADPARIASARIDMSARVLKLARPAKAD